jgi:hypothetical protein
MIVGIYTTGAISRLCSASLCLRPGRRLCREGQEVSLQKSGRLDRQEGRDQPGRELRQRIRYFYEGQAECRTQKRPRRRVTDPVAGKVDYLIAGFYPGSAEVAKMGLRTKSRRSIRVCCQPRRSWLEEVALCIPRCKIRRGHYLGRVRPIFALASMPQV